MSSIVNSPAMSVADLPALRKRNEARLQECKERMGAKWLLHPANAARKARPEENQNFTRIKVLSGPRV